MRHLFGTVETFAFVVPLIGCAVFLAARFIVIWLFSPSPKPKGKK